jgi:type II secretory pathway component GspD/PulD (secretin)
MPARLTCSAVTLAYLVSLASLSSAQDPEPVKATPRPLAAEAPALQRAVYQVRHGDAAAIAASMARLFRNEAEVLAAPTGNTVLVSGKPASVEEALKLMDVLDQAPRSVEVDITLAEVPRKEGADPTPAELTAAALAKGGQKITLVAVEGQPVTSSTGGNKPVVSGTTGGGGGFGGPGGGGPPARRMITYQNVGTTVQMTARVGEKDSVLLDLSIQDSKVRPPDAADDTGATSVDSVSLATRLSVPAGKTVVARAVRADGKAGATVAVVVVSARVVGTRAPSPAK